MRAIGLVLRSSTWPEAIAVALIAAASGLVLMVPSMSIERAAVEGLQQTLASSAPEASTVTVTVSIRDAEEAGDLWDPAGEVADEALAEVAWSLGEADILAESVRFDLLAVGEDSPPLPVSVDFRIHPAAEAGMRVVAEAEANPPDMPGGPMLDVALSAASADKASLEAGDVLTLVRRPQDPRAAYLASAATPVVARVARIVEFDDAATRFGDDTLARPLVVDTSLGADLFLTALIAEDDVGAATDLPALAGLAVERRQMFEPGPLTPTEAGTLEAAARRLDAATRDVPSISGEPGVRTGVVLLLEQERRRREAATQVLDAVMLSVLATVLIASVAVGSAAAARRRTVTAATRGRGGSAPSLLVGAALGSVPPIVLGTLSAVVGSRVLVPGADPTMSDTVQGAVIILAGVVIASAVDILKPLPTLLGKARSRRWAMPAFVALAVLSTLALVSGRAGGAAGGLAPVLVATVAALAAQRLLRLPMGLAAQVARRGVTTVGLWSGLRGRPPTGVVVPVAVALAAAGVAGGVLLGIDRAVETAGWRELSAPVSIVLPQGAPGDLLADLPVAPIATTDVRLRSGSETDTVTMMLVDPAAMTRILRGTPADPVLPPEMGGHPVDAPIPIVLSTDYGRSPVTEGTTLAASIDSVDVQFMAVDVRTAFPGMPSGEAFAVASAADFSAAVGNAPLPRTFLASELPDSLRDRVEAAGGSVVSRTDVSERLLSLPLNSGVVRAVSLSLWITLGLGVAAAVAALTVTLPDLGRRSALLGAVGAVRSQRRLVALAELAPSILAGLVGALIGVWASASLGVPRIDLGPFGATTAGIPIDAGIIARWVGAAALTLLAVVVCFASAAVRVRPAPVLRGDAAG